MAVSGGAAAEWAGVGDSPLLTDGDGTKPARLVQIGVWEHWIDPGTEMTIVLSEHPEEPL
jgi:hypothetical protein